jgi:hypothetical protein
MLKIINTEHPRLYINSRRLNEMSELAKNDEFFQSLKIGLVYKANKLLTEIPVQFEITGPRMLKNCQEILSRVATLSLSYHLSQEQKYAIRAKDELLSAANYPHWNKDHFLDTAELITAFAIGYDWLFNVLPKSDLEIIKNALITKGLKVGLDEHKNNIWWAQHKFNWNQVCNGGLIIGSLAIADEEPQLFNEIVEATAKHLPIAFNSYGKDGGWEAGPDYWQYTTWYSALLLDALQGVTGNDFGLMKTKGFDKTGLFPIYAAGANDKYFNFADADENYTALPILFWLGKQFNLDVCINENHRLLKQALENKTNIDAFNLIWYAPVVENSKSLPESRLFSDINAGFMRSKWADKEALSVAFKGGHNQADHAHLDLGSFVFDMLGVRWASELGRDNYDLPNYWDLSEGGGRWKYFRLNTKSHNTLVINNDNQRALATAEIIDFKTSENESIGVIDLTAAYKPHVKSVLRTIKLVEGSVLVVNDIIEWEGSEKTAQWQILTDAEISLFGGKAILKKDGKEIYATIISPTGSVFESTSAQQVEPESQNKGFKQLIIRKTESSMVTEIAVSFCEKP